MTAIGIPVHSLGLQAIRGIAALLVLFQHVFWLASYFANGPTEVLNSMLLGGTGVFLFFALSGFLMAGQMSRPPRRFLLDRVRRIYPGLALAFVVSGVLLSFFSYKGWPEWTTFFLLPTGTPDPIYLPYWTLIYEVQFYVIILLIGQLSIGLRLPALVLWAISIIFYHPVSPYDVARVAYPSLLEIGLSYYNLYFIVGAFAWFSRDLFVRWWELKVATALIVVTTLINMVPAYAGRVFHILLPFAMFLSVRGAAKWMPVGVVAKALVKFGDVSYGVYLIHITTCFVAMLIVKEVLKISMGYWSGALLLFLVGGGAAYLFGLLELKSQNYLKTLTMSGKPGRAVDKASELAP